MTSSKEQLVPVEQVDRDAAADCLDAIRGYAVGSAIRRGGNDRGFTVQAFARHRLAALRTPPATDDLDLEENRRLALRNLEKSGLRTPPAVYHGYEMPEWSLPVEPMTEEFKEEYREKLRKLSENVHDWREAHKRAMDAFFEKNGLTGTPPTVEPDEGLVESVAQIIRIMLHLVTTRQREQAKRAAESIIATITPSIRAQALDEADDELCDDCPPVGYPTDKTRCLPCPRRSSALKGGKGV